MLKKISFVSFILMMMISFNSDAQIQFKKHIVYDRFVSEGVAIGDVNHDKKTDILAGSYWFEAPDWKPHLIHADTLNPVRNTVQVF